MGIKSRPGSVRYPPRSRAAEYLTRHVEACEATQVELAKALGYSRPNIISMWKKGHASIPLNRVEAIASSVKADPAHLLRLILEDHYPEVARVLAASMGMLVSENERAILEHIRTATADADPPITAELRQRLTTAFSA